ncbi:Uncharacterized protein SCG7086_BC_00150 [Chlamydiales bacterium SCGC AG-110-P3]|nr:Uncharacterized protein SCG7086_BC_00150 [Chlamydiales bacterium SCGC AG-110-P3]
MINDPVLQQAAVFAILGASLVLFVTSVIRYDITAVIALTAVTVVGIVPAKEAFLGFGHPAVVTVAMVLVLSKALQNAGVVDLIAKGLMRIGNRPSIQVLALTALITAISGFMNNVGALAILMPVTLQLARKSKLSPSILLMPLAFGSLLGGMTTLIGTPPNIIIATFRQDALGEPFGLFDFAPVGASVAVLGVLFLGLIGWRFVPIRRKEATSDALFDIQSYITELKVPKGTPAVGKTFAEFEGLVDGDVMILGVVRRKKRLETRSTKEQIKVGDLLIVEADSAALEQLTAKARLKIAVDKELEKEVLASDDLMMMEAVVMPNSTAVRRTPGALQLKRRFGINLLAVARQGRRLKQRFNQISLSAGDVLLLRGGEQNLQDAVPLIGCLPLAERPLRVGQKRRLLAATGIFLGALATIAVGVFQIQIAFCVAIILMLLLQLISTRELYSAIDWPIIVLLGAMIPVGKALETTGAAAVIAEQLVYAGSYMPPAGVLSVIFIGTMFLSDLVNNAAAAVLMAPIALRVANGLSVSADPFLMAVAIGASCAFLTPIGHQSSALVMGPGGYRFGDYWRLGLPLEVLITVIGIPALLYFWPL